MQLFNSSAGEIPWDCAPALMLLTCQACKVVQVTRTCLQGFCKTFGAGLERRPVPSRSLLCQSRAVGPSC